SDDNLCATIDTIRGAATRIAPHVHRTPVMTCEAIDVLSNRQVYFKCELFQKTGSFKARGACNAALTAPKDSNVLVTSSSGNHAQGLAWAAKKVGMRAHVVMPKNSSTVKVAAVRGYGAEITFCEPTLESRQSTAKVMVEQLNGLLIHPSDNPAVISGQGTAGLELIEQVRDMAVGELDAIIVPVGGGGLISGVTIAAKAMCPGIRIIGAEPLEADDAFRSKACGRLCGHDEPPLTIADGLRTILGTHTWPVVRDLVDDIVTVSEGDIRKWMRVVYERMKLAIEPSSAVGV
ncbi:unnamed protein product, partial [Choristocarpus tenellus]